MSPAILVSGVVQRLSVGGLMRTAAALSFTTVLGLVPLFTVAFRMLGNREDAEEAIQDAFLRAFKALADYEDRERFSAWLTRILVNQCRTVLARTRRRELRRVP